MVLSATLHQVDRPRHPGPCSEANPAKEDARQKVNGQNTSGPSPNATTETGQTARERIAARLQETFAPLELDVIDESHLHAGHMGARPEGETHFRVTIVSDAFSGKTRVASHRMVNEALADFLATTVHALAISASAPKA